MGAFAYATGFKNFDKDGKTNLLSKEFRDAFNWYTGLAEKGIGVMPADIGQGWGRRRSGIRTGGLLFRRRLGSGLPARRIAEPQLRRRHVAQVSWNGSARQPHVHGVVVYECIFKA